MEVDFITLGDAASRIDVADSTLRHWTDQLEKFNVHYVKRNDRNERIYYDSDLDIFKFLKDLKQEHGRKTTTRDLALMIKEMGTFDLRTQENAPVPAPSNRTAELMTHEDIKRLLESERVRQFLSVIINENNKNLREELISEIKEELGVEREALKNELRKEIQAELEEEKKLLNDSIEQQNKIAEGQQDVKQSLEELKREQSERDKRFNQLLEQRRKEYEESKKGFWSKLFGK